MTGVNLIRGKIKLRPSEEDIEYAREIRRLSRQINASYRRLDGFREEYGVKPGESLMEAVRNG